MRTMEPVQEVEEGGSELSFHLLQQQSSSLEAGGERGGGGMGESEVLSIPPTPHRATPPFTPNSHSPNHPLASSSAIAANANQSRHSHTPASTRPSSSFVSPTVPRSPHVIKTPRTPRTPWTPSLISPRFLSPIGTPMKRVIINMKSYLEEVGHLTKLNPQDAWLPVTESRTGNAYYSAFHNLNAGIGFQGLLLPVALTFLGWSWGILALAIAYVWQLYTLWVLIRLHEAVPGVRYNRYLEITKAAFGERLGFWLATPAIFNLTAGTCTAIIIIGGGTLKLFYKTVCGLDCGPSPLSTIEWYLVFTMLSAVLAQLPNLNSIAGVSLVGAVTAVVYCTLVWALSISRSRPVGISYAIEKGKSGVATTFSILNALGIVSFAFRGHNLALEIEATMPSTLKHPAHIPMWRGAKVANAILGICYFPIAIGGYWAYGNLMVSSGILFSMYIYHSLDISQALLGFTFLLVVINCLSSFQIYSMAMFDTLEGSYTSRKNKPMSWYMRVVLRTFLIFLSFLIGVAFPFVSSLTGLLGGLTSVPVTFAYPCFMWLSIKKPTKYSFSWYLNWSLGLLGLVLAAAFSAGGVWSVVDSGINLKFFKPSG